MLLTAGLSTVPHAQLITEIYGHAPMLRTSLRQGPGSLRLSGATSQQDLKINTPGGKVR
jgi:hypothetical protein